MAWKEEFLLCCCCRWGRLPSSRWWWWWWLTPPPPLILLLEVDLREGEAKDGDDDWGNGGAFADGGPFKNWKEIKKKNFKMTDII